MKLLDFHNFKGVIRLDEPLRPGDCLIFNPVTGEPYLPGSELKRRLRLLLEKDAATRANASELALIDYIFDDGEGPARVIFRDAPLISGASFAPPIRETGKKPFFPPAPTGARFALDAGRRHYEGDPETLTPLLSRGLKLLATKGLRDPTLGAGGVISLENLTLDNAPLAL